MIKELFFINEPFEFKKGVKIYPPTVKDVLTNNFFEIYYQILSFSAEDIEDSFAEDKIQLESYPSPYEYLLGNSYNDKDYERYAIQAFEFFTHQKVSFLYEAKKIVFGDITEILSSLERIEDLVFLEEREFFDFQNVIRESVGRDAVKPQNPNEHPKVKEMKRKARQRDRIKAKQNKKNGITLYSSIVSICCMGIGITPLNIGKISYAAMSELLTKYQNKEKYTLDIQTILAGGDSKKINPKYWIANSDE